jgi:quercetin dioxygenase-like cupin family protein
MDAKTLSDIERYRDDKHVLVPVFDGERTKVRLLCLAPGTEVPAHGHEGFEITLVPLAGRAVAPQEDGTEMVLEPGQVHFAGGSESFGFRNPHSEPFQMLIHLVKQ